ncbi:copper tolerance protein [Alsobacter metallidurans]|uniref:Copper tolerance protein n=1 Tax=Alsobacter metallidurans TaxID=340221 RepID=A0A917I7W4_9HYPH|nr:TolC family protein [Alsobacter metallidurans]GGH19421.1 copper tolerance protein [Alsobacter metallidurans]
MRREPRTLARAIGAGGLSLLLAGCVSAGPDGGLGVVDAVARNELGRGVVKVSTDAEAAVAAQGVWAALKRPLTADAAVGVALASNRALQAAYNELGVSEAAFLQASLPPNPKIGLSRLGGGLELELERSLLVSLYALATLPVRREIAGDQLRAAQMRAADATLKLATDVRRQYWRAVAANQQAATLQQAKVTTDAAAELARKLGESGGMNKLDQAREYALAAELDSQLARARLAQRLERERLTRLLGLWGPEIDFRLPSALPPLPKSVRSATDVEARALARRVDLQAARLDLESLGKSLGLTQATRFTTDLELAGNSKYDRQKTVTEDGGIAKEKLNRRGLAIEFEIPLFDFGQARTIDAEQRYMRAANLLAAKAVNVRSEAREAAMACRGTWDIARHYEATVLPLRKQIQDEALLQYSGMLVDVSSLIADVRARILAQAQAIDARRDFWIAEAELRAALAGGGAGASSGSASASPAGAEQAAAH